MALLALVISSGNQPGINKAKRRRDVPINSKLSFSFNFHEINSLW
jgi:hypothetical protein